MSKIKGWTKLREDKFSIAYNKDDSLKSLHIAESRRVTIGDRVNTKYIVWSAVYSGDPNFVKGFKTKEKATKYAIKYMRGHPNE